MLLSIAFITILVYIRYAPLGLPYTGTPLTETVCSGQFTEPLNFLMVGVVPSYGTRRTLMFSMGVPSVLLCIRSISSTLVSCLHRNHSRSIWNLRILPSRRLAKRSLQTLQRRSGLWVIYSFVCNVFLCTCTHAPVYVYFRRDLFSGIQSKGRPRGPTRQMVPKLIKKRQRCCSLALSSPRLRPRHPRQF